MAPRKAIFRTFSLLLLVIFLLTGVLPAPVGVSAAPFYASSGYFIWAKGMGAAFTTNEGKDIAVDSSGNAYTTGYFTGTVDFDPGVGVYDLSNVGSYDIFISKLDSSGNFVWAKGMGGTNNDAGRAIVLDASGNVYTTGEFSGTADFDPSAGVYSLTSAGIEDIFISKLDSNGNFVWAKKMGGTNVENGYGITLDASGNVYTTGFFSGTVDFDPGAGLFSLTSAGYYDLFISKLDSNGNFVWAKSIGGTLVDRGYSIAHDASGNVYTTGFFSGTVDFDPGAGLFNLTSAGNEDIFISKLDSSGNFVWTKGIGGTNDDVGCDITLDASGSVHTTGSFQGTVDFDPGADVFNLISKGYNDLFVSKLDSNGNFVWAKGIGGSYQDYGYSIALDPGGSVYTTGEFQGAVDFDPGADLLNLISTGGRDIFISRLDSNGGLVWAKGIGGTNHDIGNGIALDLSRNVYTTGYFQGTADFDPGAGMFNLTGPGYYNIFIAKHRSPIFADVLETYWAWSYIERLYAAGITGGCGTSPLQYCPETTVTRSQMAVFLLRGIHGSSYNPPVVGGSTGFGDVSVDYWSAAWIKQLATEGITGGCGSGNYCPEYPVTRDQMAVFLLRSKYGSSYSPPAVGTSTGFGDVPVDHWAAPWIKQLVMEGITAGCGNGNYCPGILVSRAQMAVFLVRNFNLP